MRQGCFLNSTGRQGCFLNSTGRQATGAFLKFDRVTLPFLIIDMRHQDPPPPPPIYPPPPPYGDLWGSLVFSMSLKKVESYTFFAFYLGKSTQAVFYGHQRTLVERKEPECDAVLPHQLGFLPDGSMIVENSFLQRVETIDVVLKGLTPC